MRDKLSIIQKKLIEDNVKLALARANKFSKIYDIKNMNIDVDDITSYALEGLCEAALRYDVEKKFKFSTYAVSYIDNYIKTNVYAENPTIRVPKQCSNLEKNDRYRYLALTNSMVMPVIVTEDSSEGKTQEALTAYIDTNFLDIEDKEYFKYILEALDDFDKSLLNILMNNKGCLKKWSSSFNVHPNTLYRKRKELGRKILKLSRDYKG